MYELLGICLSLAGLLAINSFGSLLAAVFWRGASRASDGCLRLTRAQFLFLLRIAPCLAAILCVAALLVPSYWSMNPVIPERLSVWNLACWRGCRCAG